MNDTQQTHNNIIRGIENKDFSNTKDVIYATLYNKSGELINKVTQNLPIADRK
jgi:hypothetical protein